MSRLQVAVNHTFRASSFAVARFEDLQEIAQLRADLIECYKPVNSQELVAIERMALAQQMIYRGARIEAGLFTAAMNETMDMDGEPTYFLEARLVNDDVEITRQQNRNMLVGEGMRRMSAKSNIWSILLRYKAQAERDYRRASRNSNA